MNQNNINKYSLISLSSEELSSINGGNIWNSIQSAAHRIAVNTIAATTVMTYVLAHQLDILSNYGDGFSAGATQATKK